MLTLTIVLRKEVADKTEALSLADQVKTKAALVGINYVKAKINELILEPPEQEE